ncbi:hypothetical protein HDU81_007174 [Chytriomyces hyalinus]|nr:hypothetical protein HDU81_007174 [Chytriomyces hyalinus]
MSDMDEDHQLELQHDQDEDASSEADEQQYYAHSGNGQEQAMYGMMPMMPQQMMGMPMNMMGMPMMQMGMPMGMGVDMMPMHGMPMNMDMMAMAAQQQQQQQQQHGDSAHDDDEEPSHSQPAPAPVTSGRKKRSPKRAAKAETFVENDDEDMIEERVPGQRNPKIPIPRVKAIMKEDEDVLLVGLDASAAVAFAAEAFLEYFGKKCLESAVGDKRKTVQYKDMVKTVREVSNLNFLEDLIPPMIPLSKAKEARKALEKPAAGGDDQAADANSNPNADENEEEEREPASPTKAGETENGHEDEQDEEDNDGVNENTLDTQMDEDDETGV